MPSDILSLTFVASLSFVMSPKTDKKVDGFPFVAARRSFQRDWATEKDLRAIKTDVPRSHRLLTPNITLKAWLFAFVGSCLALTWLLHDSLPTTEWDYHQPPLPTFDLVKNAVPAPSATPYSSVLECFQVYQPVLTPSGATDETVLGNGSENTTTIAEIETNNSCDVVLMVHSFGLSYGKPFVGMYSVLAFICLS